MSFFHRYNYNDVFIRSVLIGMLSSLHEKLHIKNQISDTEIIDVVIPFQIAGPSDERFMQDFFLPQDTVCNVMKTWGNIETNPKGYLTFTGVNINSDQLTQKFVRGRYNKMDENGEIKAYSAYINSIPLTFSFDLTITFDTLVDAFKITEAIWTTLYKVQVFSVNYKGFLIPSQYGFPDSHGIEKLLEYQFDTDRAGDTKITTSLEVETFYPIIDVTTEQFMGDTVEEWKIQSMDVIPPNSSKNG